MSLRRLLLVLLSTAALTADARAQNPPNREGFWFNSSGDAGTAWPAPAIATNRA